MVFRKYLFIFGLVMVLAGNTYGAGTHSRTVKNSFKDTFSKIVSIMQDMSEALKSGIEKIKGCSNKKAASEVILETASKCNESIMKMMEMMEIMTGLPEFAEDKDIIDKAQTFANDVEDKLADFKNAIEEWSDAHGLTEKEKNDLKSIIEGVFN
ncbi:MAG: hypothetical protein A2014_03390 [Spirochaetes bacterium GWF1_49_6]|nr:MAG: hypothetical protein A2014_03390 [Spirochaetes bacterium GWF1_49_6]